MLRHPSATALSGKDWSSILIRRGVHTALDIVMAITRQAALQKVGFGHQLRIMRYPLRAYEQSRALYH